MCGKTNNVNSSSSVSSERREMESVGKLLKEGLLQHIKLSPAKKESSTDKSPFYTKRCIKTTWRHFCEWLTMWLLMRERTLLYTLTGSRRLDVPLSTMVLSLLYWTETNNNKSVRYKSQSSAVWLSPSWPIPPYIHRNPSIHMPVIVWLSACLAAHQNKQTYYGNAVQT